MDGKDEDDPVLPVNQARLGAEMVARAVLATYGPEKAPEVLSELSRQAYEDMRRAEKEADAQSARVAVFNTWAYSTLADRRATHANVTRKDPS